MGSGPWRQDRARADRVGPDRGCATACRFCPERRFLRFGSFLTYRCSRGEAPGRVGRGRLTIHLTRRSGPLGRGPGLTPAATPQLPQGGTLQTSQQLFDRWSSDLSRWGVPEAILAAAPEEPWVFPRGVFAGRARRQVIDRAGPSYHRAVEALPAGGSVIDVGSGAGAASLPLAPRASRITAIDTDPAMLSSLTAIAAGLGAEEGRDRAPEGGTVAGRWADVAGPAPAAAVLG